MTETNVPAQADEPSQDGFYGWDWTQTTHPRDERIVNQIVRAMGGAVVTPGKGMQGWPMSVVSYDADGFKIGTVYFGGARDDVHVQATSGVADVVRPLVNALPEARTARVDTRVDTLLSFERCAAVLEAASMTYGSDITEYNKRNRGESKGRTVYLGSPRSRIYVRLYEKWLQAPGEYADGTNRVEVQLRPSSREKGDVSAWDRGQTFCASRVTRDLAERLGAAYAPEASLRVGRGRPDLERSMSSMGTQYGKQFLRFMELSGGDLERVLAYLSGPVQGPDPATAFSDRLLSDRRAMDDLLRGAERIADDPAA